MKKYFKVIWNRKVIDLLSYEDSVGPVYVKFQAVHGIPVRCNKAQAQGFLSDKEKIYNTSALLPFPIQDKYLTVSLEEISENEYKTLDKNNFKTAQEIREDFLLEILERGI